MRDPAENSRREPWRLKRPDADSSEPAASEGPAAAPPNPPAEAGRGRTLRRLKLVLLLLYLGGIAVLATWAVRVTLAERDAAISAALARTAEIATAAEEHLARSFGEADAVLNFVADAVRRDGPAPEDERIERTRMLESKLRERPQVAGLVLLDGRGRILQYGARSGLSSNTGEWNPAAAAFDAARATLGRAVPDPVDGRWTIPLARRIRPDDAGNEAQPAIVAALLAPSYFEAAFRGLALPAGGSILVLHGEGRLLARFPATGEPLDTNADALPPFRPEYRNLRTAHIRQALPGADGLRVGAFIRLADYPAIVLVSVPEDVAMQTWREAAFTRGIAVVMAALLAALILLSIHLEARRRFDAAAAARQAARANDELLRSRTTALAELDAQLAAFSYSISHDLRTPLRAINGFAQTLAEDFGDRLDDEGRAHLARIRRAAERMGESIDRLVELAGLSRSTVHRGAADLSEIVRSIAADVRRRDPQREAVFDIAPGVQAAADGRLVRILLAQLLDNAWKFTRERQVARIAFGALRKDGATVYFIDDNGIGFDMAHAARLFEPFQRLHPGAAFEGSGIGLATVKRIVELHGGRVWVDAVAGRGVTVFFTLCGDRPGEPAAPVPACS